MVQNSTPTPRKPSDPPASYAAKFAEGVQEKELEQVAIRRETVHGDATDLDRQPPLKAGLVGLAFSGGGIRSGTFNLGILQALGRLKLLTRLDYLSTVSGGGYIGAWLAAWVRRAPADAAPPGASAAEESKARVEFVQKHLNTDWGRDPANPPAAEPEPVQHLREHSRYLALNSGVLTLDMWSLLTIYVRNVFINLLIVVPLVLTVVFACRWLVTGYGRPAELNSVGVWVAALVFCGLFMLRTAMVRWAVLHVARDARHARTDPASETSAAARHAGPSEFLPHVGLIAASLLVAFLGVWLPRVLLEPIPGAAESGQLRWRAEGPALVLKNATAWLTARVEGARESAGGAAPAPGAAGPLDGLAPFALAWGVFLTVFVAGAVAVWVGALGGEERAVWPGWRTVWRFVFNSLAFSVLYVGLIKYVLFYDPGRSHPALYATVGPPLFMLAVLAANYLEVAVAGATMDEFEREWRSRTAALVFRLGFAWAVLFAAVVYLPYGVRELNVVLWKEYAPNRPKTLWYSLVAWLVATAGGFLAARRASEHSSRRLLLAVRVMPVVFLGGLLGVGSELSVVLVQPPDPAPGQPNDFVGWVERTDPGWAALALGVSFAATVFAVWLIPANLFSLHSLYMNRLTRCYLGASRAAARRDPRGPGLAPKPRRRPNTFSGFDPRDDLPLADLRGTNTGAPYLGPYPLFNTTLNLVGGADLAYQDRKGASFVLTPDYCGSELTGYARLNAPDADTKHHLTLGRAMTISGAAVDPNMKNFQSGPLTAFLTVLNARLGWWIQNPNVMSPAAPAAPLWERAFRGLFRRPRARWWTARTSNLGGWRYLQEFAGYTTAGETQVHLSDGGHFDNSGAYELIRRRCRYVIAVDAAEDTDDASENLANLIRLVRADFGIDIEIDTAPLRKDEKGISRAHCATGAIRYDQVDPRGAVGTFVFIRSSLTGDESADLKNYANTKPPFPHHSTADQFFDDVQFESYRKLGEHIGLAVFAESLKEVEVRPGLTADQRYREFNRQLFAQLRRRWTPRHPSEAGYRSSCQDYLKAVAHLRDRPELRPLSRDLFPELDHVAEPGAPAEEAPTAAPAGARPLTVDLVVQLGGPLAANRPAGPETELHAVDYLLQVMELAWIDNGLEDNHSTMLNRGWMNVFRRWTAAEAFHRYWPLLRGQYSRGFTQFCERALNLDRLPVQWCRLADVPPALRAGLLAELDDEFRREWASVLRAADHVPEAARERYLTWAVGRATLCNRAELAWVLTVGRGGEKPGEMTEPWTRARLPLGLVVAFYSGGVWPPVARRELLVWVRGGHRTLGLARESVPTLLDERIRPAVQECCVRELFVRYPQVGTSSADRLQQRAWDWFFFDLGFVRDLDHERVVRDNPDLPRERRLVLRLDEPCG